MSIVDEERRIEEEKYLETVNNLINQQIIKADLNIEEAPKRYRHRYSGVAGGDEDLIENMIKMFSLEALIIVMIVQIKMKEFILEK